jgi:rubredoxin
MDTFKCSICGYSYASEIGDEENGVPCGTTWHDLPEHWSCPVCSLGKKEFYKEETCEKCM